MFLFKKLIAPFLMPVPFCLALVLLGLALLWFTRRQKAGEDLTTLGAGGVLLLGYGGRSGRGPAAAHARAAAHAGDGCVGLGRARALGGGARRRKVCRRWAARRHASVRGEPRASHRGHKTSATVAGKSSAALGRECLWLRRGRRDDARALRRAGRRPLCARTRLGLTRHRDAGRD